MGRRARLHIGNFQFTLKFVKSGIAYDNMVQNGAREKKFSACQSLRLKAVLEIKHVHAIQAT